MDLAWEPLREPDAKKVWESVLRPVAAGMRAQAAELAELCVARMQAEMQVLFPDPQAVTENVVSTEAGIRQLADLIDVGGRPQVVELPAPTRAVARAGVRRQIPLASLSRFYRLSQELMWQWMWERITASTSDRMEQAVALRLATDWIFGYIDAALNLAEQAYETEREAWLRNTAAVRTDAIGDILELRERDQQRASKRLRYDVNRHHVAAVAWVDSPADGVDAQSTLGEALTLLSGALGGETTLIHPAGSLAAFGWFSRPDAFGDGAFAEDAGRLLRPPPLPPGVRVGLGEPGHGLKGFRCSHIQAANARRVASLIGPGGQIVTSYRDVAVAALASGDAEHAVAFVHRVLGALAADDEATYRVAMTLSVYLQENRSRARTAERLTVHPNTVSYRVDQAEKILGRSIDTESIDLAVALILLPALHGLADESRHAEL